MQQVCLVLSEEAATGILFLVPRVINLIMKSYTIGLCKHSGTKFSSIHTQLG